MRTNVNSPLVWFGGKASIKGWIINHFPPHDIFVDVFGGGASIILGKPLVKTNVYNDVGFVAIFFKMLRDPILGPKLISRLELTPMSRMEYEYSRKGWKYEDDPVEQVAKWYVSVMQCFTHEPNGTGWIGVGKAVSQAQSFTNHVDDLHNVVEKFRRIQLEHNDFRTMFEIYDSPHTLFYLDPPYTSDSRTQDGNYEDELTLKDHKDLLGLAQNCKGMAVISGYTNPLYEAELMSWEHDEMTRQSHVHNSSQTVGTRTEHVWVKPHNRKLVERDLWSDHEDGLRSLSTQQQVAELYTSN